MVDQSFLKMCAKNLVKVTKVGNVLGRKRPPTLRNLSSSSAIKIVLLRHVVLIMQVINIIIIMDNIRQERPNRNSNKRLK